MGKRRADADQRRFLDEFEGIRVGRFRALGVIDPARRTASIPWPSGKVKLLGVGHTKLKYGGGWSYFICPRCAKLAAKLYDIEDQPLCVKCCAAMNIRHRSSHGFGRAARRQACDQHLDEIIAKLESTEPLTVKPAPAAFRGKRALMADSQRLTERMHRRMISLRLNEIASQQAIEGRGLARAYKPTAEARQIIDVSSIWKARTHETLARALDCAQAEILKALNGPDVIKQLAAAKLLLRTKQARERNL